jgi:hypothetical protein
MTSSRYRAWIAAFRHSSGHRVATAGSVAQAQTRQSRAITGLRLKLSLLTARGAQDTGVGSRDKRAAARRPRRTCTCRSASTSARICDFAASLVGRLRERTRAFVELVLREFGRARGGRGREVSSVFRRRHPARCGRRRSRACSSISELHFASPEITVELNPASSRSLACRICAGVGVSPSSAAGARPHRAAPARAQAVPRPGRGLGSVSPASRRSRRSDLARRGSRSRRCCATSRDVLDLGAPHVSACAHARADTLRARGRERQARPARRRHRVARADSARVWPLRAGAVRDLELRAPGPSLAPQPALLAAATCSGSACRPRACSARRFRNGSALGAWRTALARTQPGRRVEILSEDRAPRSLSGGASTACIARTSASLRRRARRSSPRSSTPCAAARSRTRRARSISEGILFADEVFMGLLGDDGGR